MTTDLVFFRHENKAEEFTIGTFSWLQGNLYPSFALVTVQENGLQVTMCRTPNQLGIYVWYIALGVISILVILFVQFNSNRQTLGERQWRYSVLLRREFWTKSLVVIIKVVAFIGAIYPFFLWIET